MSPNFALSFFVRSAFWGAALRTSFAFTFLTLWTATGHAQQVDPARMHERIAAETKAIAAAERDHLPKIRLAWGWEHLALDYEAAADFLNSEKAFTRALGYLENDPENVINRAQVLDTLGHLYLVYGRVDEARGVRSKALDLLANQADPKRDPLQVARAQSHLAEVDLLARKYKKAFATAEKAYQTMMDLHESIPVEPLSSLVVMAYAQCDLHNYADCLANAQKAAELGRSSFPADAMPLGAALLALGYAELKTGNSASGEATTRQALDIMRQKLVAPDPRLVHALTQYRDVLLAEHNKKEADRIGDQLDAMNRDSVYACASCTVNAFAMTAPR